ncbi:PREDICTED: zinc finger protein Elbow [Nicrophorus vespilloides]|uniref:Zinc finger protein Elbow n=1 Tax=Nicrophorus vespilloides TaxID=110193 RepID=A0ABM1MPR2_NICVS|nr:PREDICTED: zinc finger protein Elbow [Nicrophorus vespilloides]
MKRRVTSHSVDCAPVARTIRTNVSHALEFLVEGCACSCRYSHSLFVTDYLPTKKQLSSKIQTLKKNQSFYQELLRTFSNNKMITSSNQYLRPEYLTPLPTTLDAKKSPLALLAQTCSQIGADSPNSKLIQSGDKKSKGVVDLGKDKSGKPESPHKANFKPYENIREKSKTPEERSGSASNRVRTPVASNKSVRCNSNQSATSLRESPKSQVDEKEESSPSKISDHRTISPPTSVGVKLSATQSILTSSSSDPAVKDLPLGTFKPGMPPTSAYLGAYHPTALPLGMDLMTSSHLMSQHHALKASGLNPYLNYARMKSPSDPLCRDPYCTGCSLNSHLLGPASAGPKTPTSCSAGCTQCDHATSKPSYMSASSAAAVYAHAQLAALAAASHLPYVCNWISGDAAYCGKRFSSSEELLTHLRTHTSTVSESSSPLSMLSAPGLPPNHPLLHRTYPTPPLSPLANPRYHPYSKPSLLPPSLTSSPLASYPLAHPGLNPYLSPYSIYGPRLGAAPGMHP